MLFWSDVCYRRSVDFGASIRVLLSTPALDRLLERGDSIVCIEHHLDVIAAADHVIEMGPEAGAGGGRVVATGTPEELSAVKVSHTGRFLREHLAGRGGPSGRRAAGAGRRQRARKRAEEPA